MNRRQKIIVSVTGIFLVLLILMGLTYAYFLTQISGNTNPTSISVTTANLELLYSDGTNIIFEDGFKVKPLKEDEESWIKTFSVQNNGDSIVDDYNVYLENVVNELVRKDDLIYKLECTITSEDSNRNGTSCNGVETITFPSTNGTIVKNSIYPEDTHSYVLTLRYKEMNVDQSIDMNKQINAKVNIYDNNEIENRLNEIIMHDTRITKNSGIPEFTGVETNEGGMYSAQDDYGTSWYFRGAQENNYVKFAGFTWRIVRINGDGSIRLILDGTLDKVIREGETEVAGTLSNFALKSWKDNAYVGYMTGYGFKQDVTGQLHNINEPLCLKTIEGVVSETSDTEETCANNGGVWTSPYDATHMNIHNSVIKDAVDKFYEDYIENSSKNYHYGEYLADTLFCGDKSVADTSIGEENSGLGYGYNVTLYAVNGRLVYSEGTAAITNMKPTLECAKGEPNTYSRYTSNSSVTSKGVNVNSDLDYPIALLSADEAVMAGTFKNANNTNYYLSNENISDKGYWMMTPMSFKFGVDANIPRLSLVNKNGRLMQSGASNNSIIGDYGVRPVINLKNNIMVADGEGTYLSPYIVG